MHAKLTIDIVAFIHHKVCVSSKSQMYIYKAIQFQVCLVKKFLEKSFSVIIYLRFAVYPRHSYTQTFNSRRTTSCIYDSVWLSLKINLEVSKAV